ncbi:MAG TPA: CHAP domain-containing protein [Patescibacteria group bacterium]
MKWWTLILSIAAVSAMAAQLRAPYGTELGRIDGVVAFSSGDRLWKSPKEGNQYQCVDLVKRFVQSKGVKWVSLDGQAAASLFPMVEAGRVPGLTSFVNGGNEQPQRGDVVCFSDGGLGHMGIVYEVQNDEVRLIEQNWHAQPNLYLGLPLKKTEGMYELEGRTTKPLKGAMVFWRVQGWVRVKGPPRPLFPSYTYVLVDTSVERDSQLFQQSQYLCRQILNRLPDEAKFSIILVHETSEQIAIDPVKNWKSDLTYVYRHYVKVKGRRVSVTNGLDQLEGNLSAFVKSKSAQVVMLLGNSRIEGGESPNLPFLKQGKWGITVVALGPKTDRRACVDFARKSGGVFIQYEGDPAKVIARLQSR